VAAGSAFTLDVTTFDSFRNPTVDAADSFTFALDDLPAVTVSRVGAASSVTYRTNVVVAGDHKVRVALSSTGEEVRGSPFNFNVKASVAHAAASTYDIEPGETIDSSTAPAMVLSVEPMDFYENSATGAVGYKVSMNGADPEELLPPDYSWTYPIPLLSSADVHLNITLNGEEIANSPVVVSVKPTTAIYVGGMSAALLFFMAVSAWTTYRKISSKGFDTKAEKAVSVDQKLRKILNMKMWLQNVYMGIEVSTLTQALAAPF
jgi:hypothetical protein